jgi:hypothetical protein
MEDVNLFLEKLDGLKSVQELSENEHLLMKIKVVHKN